jgi:hypothetical protein
MRDRGNRRARLAGVLTTVAVFAGSLLAQPPPAKPAADLNQLMRGLFFPHSNVVFSTQDRNPAEIPKARLPSASTDPLTGIFNGWDAVENSALTLIEGADLLMTPGRVCSNGREVPLKAPDWAKFVEQLRQAGQVAYQAAKTKNTDKMVDASEVLNTACANCHNKYRRAKRCE